MSPTEEVRRIDMTELKTHTLDVPGAVLSYDVRANDASTEPLLLIIGSPMGAAGFVTLAGHFTDRTVVTYDPRGFGKPAADARAGAACEEEDQSISRGVRDSNGRPSISG